MSSLLKTLLVKILTRVKSFNCVVSALTLGVHTEGDLALCDMENVSFELMGCRIIVIFSIDCFRINVFLY